MEPGGAVVTEYVGGTYFRRCGGHGFESRSGVICSVSLLLSLNLFSQ